MPFSIDNISSLLSSKVSEGANALKTEFISNNLLESKKVLTYIKDGLSKCTEFYISVAFITKGGIEPLIQILNELKNKKIKGYILTTDYLNFNDPDALDKLATFENITLKMYLTPQGRNNNDDPGFHTKGYIFKGDIHNKDQYQIIIGSSNLTTQALSLNKEWNTLLTVTEDIKFIHDVLEEFKQLWIDDHARDYQDVKDLYRQRYEIIKAQQKAAIDNNVISFDTYNLKPNKMQQEFISKLKHLLNEGKEKALFISATGTGKTYASAFAIREINPKKALFVVHREQIAKKSLKSYSIVFNGSKSLGLLSGNSKDYVEKDIVFATQQTLCKKEIYRSFNYKEFDVIVVDEAHRIGGSTYQELLKYFKPNLLLGMTATPERTDDFDVYKAFDNNIVYEIRLQQALEYDFLCPFHYFGITDLHIETKDESKLSDFRYLCRNERVNYILEKLDLYWHDGHKVKGLIFCSRNDEAQELSNQFNKTGIYKTIALSGANTQEERDKACELLESDDPNEYLDYIFTVDIFNEGIDIPAVNQVVMLRPTQSPIVFIQQLGRGLRKADNKNFVVVIDFIGNYNNNYMIPMALSGDRSYKRENLRRFVNEGEKIIPGASSISFDSISKQKIFESIDSTNFSEIRLIKENYKRLKQKVGRIPSIKDFNDYGEMDILNIVGSLDSYHNFLKKYEPEYKITFSDIEEIYISYISTKFLNGKRSLEPFLIKEILEGNESELLSILNIKYNIKFDSYGILNLFNIMTNQFLDKNCYKKYRGVEFIKKIGKEFYANESFTALLKNNKIFKSHLTELIDNAIYRNINEYSHIESDTGFNKYKLYSYEDVCRILSWEKDEHSTIFGYKWHNDGKHLPIFVTYHKSDKIKSSIKYEDRFISKNTFHWISKSGKNLESEPLKKIFDQKKFDRTIMLFIRKENIEKSKEFYYLGKVNFVENSQKEIQMQSKNGPITAVEMNFKFEEPVRDDIYDYLVNQAN